MVIGRLKPGVTPQQATAELNAIAAQLAKEHPKTDKAVSVRLIRPGLMGDDGEGIRRFLYSVNVLALLLLAAVCVNLASAFGARAADRSRELAVRVALGSSRLRLVRQQLTEALVIALIGGAAGLASAHALLAALNRWPASLGSGHQRLDLDLDPRVYLAGLALTVASALLFGMVPARHAWAGSPLQVIKNGLADPARRRILPARRVARRAGCDLHAAGHRLPRGGARHEAGARWVLRGHQAAGRDAGLDRPRRLEGDRALQKQKEMIEAVRSIPGVTAVGAVRETPMSWPRRVIPVYRPGTTELTAENQALATHVYPMSPEYLKAAGTQLLEGRDVSWQDTKETPARGARERDLRADDVGRHPGDRAALRPGGALDGGRGHRRGRQVLQPDGVAGGRGLRAPRAGQRRRGPGRAVVAAADGDRRGAAPHAGPRPAERPGHAPDLARGAEGRCCTRPARPRSR